MAFHPFQIVRKNQKVLLVLATIFCMVVFILQFGSGDIFSRFGLGHAGPGKGETVVKLYGKELAKADIDQILQSRRMANMLVQSTVEAALPDADKNVKAFNPDKPNEIDDTLKRLSVMSEFQSRIQLLFQGVRSADQIQADIASDVRTVDAILGALTASDQPDKAKAAEQSRMAKDLRLLLKTQWMEFEGFNPQTRGALYFGGGVNTQDLLDFEIWKHQADKLGIVLTKADARRAIAYEAGDRPAPADPGGSWATDKVVKALLDQNPKITEDELATAVADEFRVQIAKTLLAGHGSGVPALGAPDLTPDPIAPYDFWNYYRDNRTSLTVAFLPIPVQSFTDKVSGSPTGPELRAIYENGKDLVPDPNRDTPGFKKPRRIRVEYLTASTDQPYYKAVLDAVQFNRQRYYFSAALPTSTAFGGALAWSGLGLVLADDSLPADYDQLLKTRRDSAAAASGVFGLSAAAYPALSPHMVALQAVRGNQEQQAPRLAVAGFQLSILGSVSGEPLGSLAGALAPGSSQIAAYYQTESRLVGPTGPTFEPPEVRDVDLATAYLWEQHRQEVLPTIVKNDLADFTNSVAEDPLLLQRHAGREAGLFAGDGLFAQVAMTLARAAEADEKNADDKTSPRRTNDAAANERARQYIEAQAQKRGWTLNDNEWTRNLKGGLDDVFEMEKDEALQPLLKGSFVSPQSVFASKELYRPQPPSAGFTTFRTYWLTEDEPETPLSYEEALDQVREAWTLLEARKLAFKKAAEICEGAKAAQDNPLGYLQSQQVGPNAFQLSGISRLILTDASIAGVRYYKPYSFSQTVMPDIYGDASKPYDAKNLVNALLALGAPGQTLIWHDKAMNTVYVAMLVERREPTFQADQADFRQDYQNATQDSAAPKNPLQPQSGLLWEAWFLPKHRADYRKDLIRRLREEAGGGPDSVDAQGQLKLSEAAQKQQQAQGPASMPPPSDESDGGDGL